MPGHKRSRVTFDLTTIELFIATADTGSVTRAAERINLAIAAASRRLKELEDQFGVSLFQRQSHGMALTEAGRALLGHARGMAHLVTRMQHDAQAFLAGDKGVVRIAACTSSVLQFLPPDLLRLHAELPQVRIDLQEYNSPGVIQAMNRGFADLGIYESSSADASLPSVPYHGDRLALVVPRGHVLARRKSVRLADILRHELIGLTQGAAISSTLQRAADECKLEVRMRILVNSFASMIAMIDQGIGIGLMPEAVAASFAANGKSCWIPIADAWAERRFLLCHQHRDRLPSAAKGVFDVLAMISLSAKTHSSIW